MKKLLMIVMASYGLTASAQGVDQTRNFIYLHSDSVIYANRVTVRPDAMGLPQLRADSRKVRMKQVKFFNNQDGFFANIPRKSPFEQADFAERVIEGRLNLYQSVVFRPYDYYPHDYGHRYRGGLRSGTGVDPRMYYNKGLGDLKKVNYGNLQHDMADHSPSMDLLEGYRKSKNTSTMLYTAAGASIVAALVSFVVSGDRDMKSGDMDWPGPHGSQPGGLPSSRISKGPSFTAAFVLLGVGAGFAIGGFSVQLSASRKLENAFDAYNR